MLGCHQQQNLGERARGRAIQLGVLMAGLGLGWALLSSELGASKKLGWLLVLPVSVSAYLLISGTLGICVYNGMKGFRGADHGSEAVLDPEDRAQLRLRALAAVSVSLVIAFACAAAFVINS